MPGPGLAAIRSTQAGLLSRLLLWSILVLAPLACRDEQAETPDWATSENSLTPLERPGQETLPPPRKPPRTEDGGHKLRFVGYNLKNFLTMTRWQDGEQVQRSKPAGEVAAVIKIITASRPDVIGLSEIGNHADLERLQSSLRDAGLDLPHSEHTGGADQTRHLALLSRFPIVARNSQSNLFFDLEGARTQIRRGLLDATVEAHGKRFRFLGAHLKSKREIRDGDQELIRRNEAFLMRKHADEILKADPATLLVVYGDFNDTRRSSPVRSISGPGNSVRFLEALPLRDDRGEVWTHYWEYQHIYSRFDYILVSRALRPLVVDEETRIFDHLEWASASDHRATLATFAW